MKATDSCKACRALAENSVMIHDGSFPSRRRSSASRARDRCSSQRAFNVIVKSLDDVSGSCLFEVGGLNSINLILEKPLAPSAGRDGQA